MGLTIKELLEKYSIPTYIDCGDGWADLLDRLLADIIPLGFDVSWVLQVKEKFGYLRFYWQESVPQDATHDTYDGDDGDTVLDKLGLISSRIRDAEIESARTCEWCGKPGKVDSRYFWLLTLCASCMDINQKKHEQRNT